MVLTEHPQPRPRPIHRSFDGRSGGKDEPQRRGDAEVTARIRAQFLLCASAPLRFNLPFVIAGPVPATHEHGIIRIISCAWMAGTSPAKTTNGGANSASSAAPREPLLARKRPPRARLSRSRIGHPEFTRLFRSKGVGFSSLSRRCARRSQRGTAGFCFDPNSLLIAVKFAVMGFCSHLQCDGKVPMFEPQ